MSSHLNFDSAVPLSRRSGRLFFWADELVAEPQHVRPAYASVNKLGEVIAPATDHELTNAGTFCSSMVRLDDSRIRAYHTVSTPNYDKLGVSMAESEDGMTWQRPTLCEPNTSVREANRIVIDGMDSNRMGLPQVVRLPDGLWRMYVWDYRLGSILRVAHSEDGLDWQLLEDVVIANDVTLQKHIPWSSNFFGYAPPIGSDAQELWHRKAIRANDAANIYYNDRTGLFEYYNQWLLPPHPGRMDEKDNIKIGIRVIQRRVSEDGLTWSDPHLILHPDENDPPDLQFYYMSVQWHEDWMIGMLGHYPVSKQDSDMVLAFSRDGRSWQRPLREPFVPRETDNPEAIDFGGIYAPSTLLDQGDYWLCLYRPATVKHCDTAAGKHTGPVGIHGATWGKNRFVGLLADDEPGQFLTEPFSPINTPITVDADVRGELRVELTDTFGKPLDGHTFADAQVINGDSAEHPLAWAGGDAGRYRYDFVRARIRFSKATVYSLCFG